MLTAKINVSKIDKTKLFKGEKGTYLDLVLIETPNDQYGNDYVVVQGLTKADRDAGLRGAILGNAKIRGTGKATTQGAPKQTTAANDEDVPF